MSEFKGTPGEWVLDIPADGRASLVIRSAKPIVEGATLPAVVAKMDRSRRCKRLLPDARLIVASPDLLVACEAFVAAFHDHPDRDEVSFALAKAAIAKAMGK